MTPVQRDPIRYVCLRHQGPYEAIGATFGRLAKMLGTPSGHFIGVYHDDPSTTPVEELRSDAGMIVDEGTAIPDGLEAGRLEGGLYLRHPHIGDYGGISASWGRFMAEFAASGRRPRPLPPFEIYVSDMETTPPAELVTELYLALEG